MMRNRLSRIERAFEDFCDDWEQDLITAIRLLDAERVKTGSVVAEGRDKEGPLSRRCLPRSEAEDAPSKGQSRA